MAKELTLGSKSLNLDEDIDPKATSNNNDDKEVQEALKATGDVEKKLSEDEKKKLEEKKKQRKSGESKQVEVAEDWENLVLSDDELKLSKELQGELSDFINTKAGISEGTGVVETLPTGIKLLDAILGGGFGVGTLTVIAGNPGTFKSSLIGQVIGNSQKKFKGKMTANYLDSESAMTKKRLWQLGTRYPAISPCPDITVEDVFKTIEAVSAFKELKEIVEYPSIVAWDSVANTTTLVEKNTPDLDINKVIGLRARILSFVMPRYCSKMKDYNVSLIAVNQLRDKMDIGQFSQANDLRWMGEKTMPGGNAIKFNAFHLLLLKIKSDLKVEQWGFNGIQLECKCIKNKLFTPNIPVNLIVDFTCGISDFWTSYKFLTDLKYLQAGAWSFIKSHPDIKWQGTYKAKEFYDDDHKGFRKIFDDSAEEAIKTHITDAYLNYGDDIPEDEV